LVIIIGLIGIELKRPLTGLLASCFCATSYLSIKWSQEFGPYMPTTFLIWLGLYLVISKKTRTYFGSLFASFVMIFAFLAHGLSPLPIVFGLIGINFFRFFENYEPEIPINQQKLFSKWVENEDGLIRTTFAVAIFAVIYSPRFFDLAAQDSLLISSKPAENSLNFVMPYYFGTGISSPLTCMKLHGQLSYFSFRWCLSRAFFKKMEIFSNCCLDLRSFSLSPHLARFS